MHLLNLSVIKQRFAALVATAIVLPTLFVGPTVQPAKADGNSWVGAGLAIAGIIVLSKDHKKNGNRQEDCRPTYYDRGPSWRYAPAPPCPTYGNTYGYGTGYNSSYRSEVPQPLPGTWAYNERSRQQRELRINDLKDAINNDRQRDDRAHDAGRISEEDYATHNALRRKDMQKCDDDLAAIRDEREAERRHIENLQRQADIAVGNNTAR